jgi:hypothetical protein
MPHAKPNNGKRKPNGVIQQSARLDKTDPSERLPLWAKPLPRESVEDYAARVGPAIHQDSLERSLRGDTAAHAKWREQALKGLGLGQRQEIDITARQDEAWIRSLTDEELEALAALKQAALARGKPLDMVVLPQQSLVESVEHDTEAENQRK